MVLKSKFPAEGVKSFILSNAPLSKENAQTVKRILIPLLNRKTPSFRKPAWYFDENVLIDTIYADDFFAIHRDYKDDYAVSLTATTKCVYISTSTCVELAPFAKAVATKTKFVLNNFSIAEPPLFTFAALINVSESSTILEVINLESPSDLDRLRRGTFRLAPGSTREVITANYRTVDKACTDNPTVLFTLERFNSSLLRSELFDQIVDITISMESLIEGKDELRYKFSLYNSLVAEADAKKRFDAFGLLQNLYDSRSAIVHGDVESKDNKKAIAKTKDNWSSILQLAKAAINYYLIFLGEHKKSEWNGHLKNLVFGLEKRLID